MNRTDTIPLRVINEQNLTKIIIINFIFVIQIVVNVNYVYLYKI